MSGGPAGLSRLASDSHVRRLARYQPDQAAFGLDLAVQTEQAEILDAPNSLQMSQDFLHRCSQRTATSAAQPLDPSRSLPRCARSVGSGQAWLSSGSTQSSLPVTKSPRPVRDEGFVVRNTRGATLVRLTPRPDRSSSPTLANPSCARCKNPCRDGREIL